MPKAPTHQDLDLANRLAEREEFESLDSWRRSKKNNLCRGWQEMQLTIFKRPDGQFAWCGVDADGEKQFSEQSFDEEAWAVGDLADFLGVGR